MSMDKISFYANVTKTELPFIRIEEGAFEGMMMMDISDEELDAYSKKREMLFDKSRTDSITKAIDAEMLERLMRLEDAKK